MMKLNYYQMNKFLPVLCLMLALSAGLSLNAQKVALERRILVTDTITDEGVTFAASSDDAEQEDDQMDSLHDDDLDAGWEGDPEKQHVLTTGLRFRNISIPRGAIIDSAYIVITSHEGKDAEDIAIITIVGHAHGNAPTFSMDALITSRDQTSNRVEWTVNVPWTLWGTYQTPDLKAIVQEIIDRSDWQSGNALALLLKGRNQGASDVDNAREFESFENISDPEDGGDGQNHPERAPKLVIHYHLNSGMLEIPIAMTDMITDEGVTFAASSDDAEQEDDEMDSLHDDDLDAGWEGDPEKQHVLTTGLRFRDVQLPKGAVVDSAFVVLTSHEGKDAEDVAIISIVGQAADNAQTFTMDALISDRPQTTASLTWTVNTVWSLWGVYRTPDIKSILQEIVDRDGWQSGNAVAILLKGQNQGASDVDNAREFESFENISDPEDGGDGQNHPERVPKLVIYFSIPMSIDKNPVITESPVVFPNPVSNGALTISLKSQGKSSIQVFSSNGKLMQTRSSNGENQITLDLSGLPKGLYIIRTQQNGIGFSHQIVVE
jgi:hypothetical protein